MVIKERSGNQIVHFLTSAIFLVSMAEIGSILAGVSWFIRMHHQLMKKLFYLLLIVCSLGIVHADSPDTEVKGVIILTSASGLHARNVLFSDLTWTDFYGGMVTGNDGQKTPFSNKDIAKIVYFDSQYYTQLDNRQDLQALRAGLQVREIVANTNVSNLLTDDDVKVLQESEDSLQYIGDRYPTVQALIQPQINVLQNDIAHYSHGQRLVSGQWVSKAQAEAQLHGKKPVVDDRGVSITTRDGKTYTDVGSIQAEEDGVSITYSGGVARILYANLPAALQKQFGQDSASVAAKKKAADSAAAAHEAVAVAKEEKQKEQANVAAEAKAAADNAAIVERKKEEADAATQAKALAYARALSRLPKTFDTATPASAGPSAGTASSGSSGVTTGTQATPSSDETVGHVADTVTYPGAEYTYDTFKDICYLDSPPAEASIFPEPETPDPLGGRTSLTLRSSTDGNEPQHPDKMVGTIISVINAGKLPDSYDVTFSVDGTPIPIQENGRKLSDALSGFGQVVEYISFSLSPDQARVIANGKSVKMSIGGNNYTLEQDQTAKLQRYFGVLDKLPARSSFLVRKFRSYINGLPPLSTLFSEICVDVILALFFFVGTLGIVLFVVGATRFLKM